MADKKKEDQAKKNPDDNNNNSNDNQALAGDELEEVVFLLQKDGTVKKGVVKTGIQDINYIEIAGGLKEGDEVITGPYTTISEKLKDGMKVTVVPKEKLFQQ